MKKSMFIKHKNQITMNREYCPICQSKNRSVIFRVQHKQPEFLDFIKLEKFYSKVLSNGYSEGILGDLLYEIVECRDCKFIYLTEVLNDLGMRLLYNEWLDNRLLKIHYNNLPYDGSAEKILKLIKNGFRKKSKINVMDFGAGYGNFCAIATKNNLNTFAFDLSTDKKSQINNMGVIIINDFEKYYKYFDFIWINQVLEHLSDPLKVLKNLRQCLSHTGIIYAAVPDCRDLKKILNENGLSEKLFKLLSPHQHINAFNNKTLKLLGLNAGMRPFSMVDFIKFYRKNLQIDDLVFLTKKTIKNSNYGTGIFFYPKK